MTGRGLKQTTRAFGKGMKNVAGTGKSIKKFMMQGGGGGLHSGYKSAVALAQRAAGGPAHSTRAMDMPLGSG